MKSNVVATAFLVLVATVVAGCVSVQATRLGSGAIHPPLSPDRVAIYRTSEQVGARYEEVAILSASGDHNYTNEEQMYASMRKKAGALGANGVILESVTEPTTGAKVAQAFLGTSANRKGKAIAIYVHSGQ